MTKVIVRKYIKTKLLLTLVGLKYYLCGSFLVDENVDCKFVYNTKNL